MFNFSLYYASFKTLKEKCWLVVIFLHLIIFGVVLDKINVFLIGFNPPFAEKSYFPAIGEIAVTVAIICTIMLLYRFFSNFFPILSNQAEKEG